MLRSCLLLGFYLYIYIFEQCPESMLEVLLLLLFKMLEFGVIKLRVLIVNAGKFPVMGF